jgi:hypothetical protein
MNEEPRGSKYSASSPAISGKQEVELAAYELSQGYGTIAQSIAII